MLNSSVYLLLGVYGFVFWSSEKAQITECSKQERAGYVLLILMGTFIVFFVFSNKTIGLFLTFCLKKLVFFRKLFIIE